MAEKDEELVAFVIDNGSSMIQPPRDAFPAIINKLKQKHSDIVDMDAVKEKKKEIYDENVIAENCSDMERVWSDDADEINEKIQLLDDDDIIKEEMIKNTSTSVRKYSQKHIVSITLIIFMILSIIAMTVINITSNKTGFEDNKTSEYEFVFIRHTELRDLTEINCGISNDGKSMLRQMHNWLDQEKNRKLLLSDRSSSDILFYTSYLARAQLTAAFVYDALIPFSTNNAAFKVLAILNEILFGIGRNIQIISEMETDIKMMTDLTYLSDKYGDIESDEEKRILLRYNELNKIEDVTEANGQRELKNLLDAKKVIQEFINYLKNDKDLTNDKIVIIIGHSHWFAQFLKLYDNHDEKCENLHKLFGIIKGVKAVKHTEIIKFKLKWIDNANEQENSVQISNCYSVYTQNKPRLLPF